MSHETFGSWDLAEYSLADAEEHPRQQPRPFDLSNLFHEILLSPTKTGSITTTTGPSPSCLHDSSPLGHSRDFTSLSSPMVEQRCAGHGSLRGPFAVELADNWPGLRPSVSRNSGYQTVTRGVRSHMAASRSPVVIMRSWSHSTWLS